MRKLEMRSLSMTMVVMLIFSSTVWSAGPVFTGNLRSSGVVLTNSVQLPDGGTVRSGDSIATKPGGLAVITSSAYGRLEVRPDSEARLSADRVQLERGAVAAGRIPVEVGGYTIQPQNAGRSWFAVAHRDGRLIVAAHRGSVQIASATAAPLVIPEGSFALQDDEKQPAATRQADQTKAEDKEKAKKKKRGAGAAAGAAAGGWTIGGLSHAASVALVVGVGAGVAAASVGAAIALTEDNPSPSQ